MFQDLYLSLPLLVLEAMAEGSATPTNRFQLLGVLFNFHFLKYVIHL